MANISIKELPSATTQESGVASKKKGAAGSKKGAEGKSSEKHKGNAKPEEEPLKVHSQKQKSTKQAHLKSVLVQLHTDDKRDAATDVLVNAAAKDEIVFENTKSDRESTSDRNKKMTMMKSQMVTKVDNNVGVSTDKGATDKAADTVISKPKALVTIYGDRPTTKIEEVKNVNAPLAQNIVPVAIPEIIDPNEMIVWRKEEVAQSSVLARKAREHWSLEVDFILHCVAFAVGIGNLWRFPGVAMSNGGFAFFFPYIICLFAIGAPMVYMEMVLGQFSNRGCIQTFAAICPLFRGIGIAMLVILIAMSTYYNSIVSLSLLFASEALKALYNGKIVWARCNNPWNSKYCLSVQENGFCNLSGTYLFVNKTCFDAQLALKEVGFTNIDARKISNNSLPLRSLKNICKCQGLDSRPFNPGLNTGHSRKLCAYLCMKNTNLQKHPSHEFLYGSIYNLTSDNMGSFGMLDVRLVASLLISWLLVAVILILGRKHACKIIYFTVCTPYILVYLMLMSSSMTESDQNSNGESNLPEENKYFFDINKAFSVKGFFAAAQEALYSLSPGLGVYIAMASYNRFHYPLLSHTALVVAIDVASNMFFTMLLGATFIVLADQRHMSIDSLLEEWTGGMSYIFVAYPESVANHKRPLKSAAKTFFASFACFLVGVDSQYIMTDTIITNICDSFPDVFITGMALHKLDAARVPKFMKTPKFWHSMLSLFICLILFFISLPMTLTGGVQLITIMDRYLVTTGCCFIMVCQIIAVCYIYDIRFFIQDIQLMYAHSSWGQELHLSIQRSLYQTLWLFFGPTSYLARFIWFFVTPACLITLIVTSLKACFSTHEWLFMLQNATGFIELLPEHKDWKIALALVLVIALSPIPIILGGALTHLIVELRKHVKHIAIPNLSSAKEKSGGNMMLARLLSPTPAWSPEWWREGGNEVEEYMDDDDEA